VINELFFTYRFWHRIFNYLSDFAKKGGYTPHRYVPLGENNPGSDA
jgi:hypothetical protein